MSSGMNPISGGKTPLITFESLQEWLRSEWRITSLTIEDLKMLFESKMENFTNMGDNLTPSEILAGVKDGGVPTSEGDALKILVKAQELSESITEFKTDIETLTGKLGSTTDAAAQSKIREQIGELKQTRNSAEAKLKKMLANLNEKKSFLKGAEKATFNDLVNTHASTLKSQQQADPAAQKGPGVDWKAMSNPSWSKSSPDAGLGKAQSDGSSYGLNTGGKADSTFNPLAMTLSSMADDFKLQSWDVVGESQKKQQMMLMFMYYARMAMSGDVGAMYQFMRFVGQIIARDKALQNVWCGTQLIKMQEASRKATKKLVEADSGDDFESQAEFSKLVQKVKSEETMIATSQKLIAQMMEEFTQVVELCTNVQKSLLDVNGKLISNISVWR